MKWLKRIFADERSHSESNSQTPNADRPQLDDILTKLASFRRDALVPITEAADGPPESSKFSGLPLIVEGTDWPVCHNCTQPMQLFFQLNLSEVDHPYPTKNGVLQLFYCTSSEPLCEVDCKSYFPFSKATLARVVSGEPTLFEVPSGDFFPGRRIVSWQRRPDFPAELEDASITDDEYDILIEHFPLSGEKLGGWPNWVQDEELPDCRTCGQQMEFLVQIDSNGHLPYMFGDMGCGHLSFCRNHPDEMSFHWACH